MKRWIKALVGGIALCLILAVCGFDGECQEIREQVVRLHILANSDSAEDQALKLQVRDAVLEAAVGWETFGEQEILQKVQQDLPRLIEVAQNTVYENGYSYSVTAKVCRMYFETRQYDDVTMPAGMYDAVRFEIGEGKGKNWWCVMYPPMCLKAAEKGETLAQVLTDRQMSIVTGEKGYKVSFKLWEVAQWLIQRFR